MRVLHIDRFPVDFPMSTPAAAAPAFRRAGCHVCIQGIGPKDPCNALSSLVFVRTCRDVYPVSVWIFFPFDIDVG